MEQVVGCEEHKAMAREISEKGITLVKYKDEDVLPMIPEPLQAHHDRLRQRIIRGRDGNHDGKNMGGGKKSPAERLRDKLIEKGL